MFLACLFVGTFLMKRRIICHAHPLQYFDLKHSAFVVECLVQEETLTGSPQSKALRMTGRKKHFAPQERVSGANAECFRKPRAENQNDTDITPPGGYLRGNALDGFW